MNQHMLERMIHEGVKGLPAETLEEIADFILFLRNKTLKPHEFENELASMRVEVAREALSGNEWSHLEEEFADYEQRFPKE